MVYIGNVPLSYEEETIDMERVVSEELTEVEKQLTPQRCKFSYTFSFSDTALATKIHPIYGSIISSEGVMFSTPCKIQTNKYGPVKLIRVGHEGSNKNKATFLSYYDKDRDTCVIEPTDEYSTGGMYLVSAEERIAAYAKAQEDFNNDPANQGGGNGSGGNGSGGDGTGGSGNGTGGSGGDGTGGSGDGTGGSGGDGTGGTDNNTSIDDGTGGSDGA
jgi:hypothetical protein